MKRILVLGCSGSGKSTFSVKLGERLKLPVIHLDSLYWNSGWVPTPDMEWDQVIETLIKKDKYVMDGNFTRTIKCRLKEADTVFYFDFPRYLCLYRVLKRRIQHHGRSRSDMAAGCKEKIDLESLGWIWNYRRRNRPKILRVLHEVQEHKEIIIFRSPKDVKKFLNNKDYM